MKLRTTFSLLIILLVANASCAQEKIRVACVGNSITYGFGIKDRELNSYPAQLGRLLGEAYDVRNFGNNARTLLSKGDLPYVKEQTYRDAIAFSPNYVLIKLGTNDTKPQNWKYNADFVTDLTSLVKSFQALPSKPVVFICYPATVQRNGNWGINDSIVVHGVIPYDKKVAKKCHVRTLDFHKVTAPYPDHFKDNVHPDAFVAGLMAQEAYKAIKGKKAANKPE
jgi:lysophospholipase L1-like esterase